MLWGQVQTVLPAQPVPPGNTQCNSLRNPRGIWGFSKEQNPQGLEPFPQPSWKASGFGAGAMLQPPAPPSPFPPTQLFPPQGIPGSQPPRSIAGTTPLPSDPCPLHPATPRGLQKTLHGEGEEGASFLPTQGMQSCPGLQQACRFPFLVKPIEYNCLLRSPDPSLPPHRTPLQRGAAGSARGAIPSTGRSRAKLQPRPPQAGGKASPTATKCICSAVR